MILEMEPTHRRVVKYATKEPTVEVFKASEFASGERVALCVRLKV